MRPGNPAPTMGPGTKKPYSISGIVYVEPDWAKVAEVKGVEEVNPKNPNVIVS
jgi:hypothetical protein